jgi:hypothetical protein
MVISNKQYTANIYPGTFLEEQRPRINRLSGPAIQWPWGQLFLGPSSLVTSTSVWFPDLGDADLWWWWWLMLSEPLKRSASCQALAERNDHGLLTFALNNMTSLSGLRSDIRTDCRWRILNLHGKCVKGRRKSRSRLTSPHSQCSLSYSVI